MINIYMENIFTNEKDLLMFYHTNLRNIISLTSLSFIILTFLTVSLFFGRSHFQQKELIASLPNTNTSLQPKHRG